ncbi:NUDIX hydrolase [Spirillospora sp. CA-108201]
MGKKCDGASVGVLVTDGLDRVLIGTRADGAGQAPVAGHVWDAHSSYRDAAVAEVREETGLHVTALEYVCGGYRPNRCRRGDGPNGPGHMWEVYRATATGSPGSADGSMVGLRFATGSEIRALAAWTVQRALGRVDAGDWRTMPGLEPVWVRWMHETGYAVLGQDDLRAVQARLIEAEA